MARPGERDLVQLGPWPSGANNIAREDSVPGGAFRRGVNVDVSPGGKVRRRAGATRVATGAFSDLWSDGAYALARFGQALVHVVPDAAPVSLYAGLSLEADITYCSVNHLVYVSDGQQALRVDTVTNTVRPWGVPTPAGQPQLTVVSGGLAPGAYQVAVTYVTADGEEGGAKLAATIDLPTGGGIQATLPAYPVPAHVAGINLYMTRPGDRVLAFYAHYPIGAINVTLGVSSLGRELRTFGLEPMPAGSAAALLGGRLVVAVGNCLVWSDPFNFGLTNLAKNFIAFAGDIDMLAPTVQGATADGAYVAAGAKTFFLTGADMAQATSRLAYANGAVRGAPVYINGDDFGIDNFPSQPLPMWISDSGFVCVGLPSGVVNSPTNGRYAMNIGDRASIAVREQNGLVQALVSVRSPTPSSFAAAGDAATSVLVRNGVVIP